MRRAGTGDSRRPRGELENEVLALLWAADQPLTVGEVLGELEADLAYTTVLTILSRLHDKGAVVRQRRGRAHAYSPVLDEAGMTARRMRAVLDHGDDRTAVLSRFVEGLSADDEAALVAVLGSLGSDAHDRG